MRAIDKLMSRTQNGYHICVGLDTDINKLPRHFEKSTDSIFEFNKNIIDATRDSAAAYKINLAFYESHGIKGLEIMKATIDYLPDNILKIGDAKRGDIGNTSRMYAESLFMHYNFDASTLNPYMGKDSVAPFIEYKEKLNFILALTSNDSAVEIERQQLKNGQFVYQKVIEKVHEWNTEKNCGIVFGATNIDELAANMQNIDTLPVLLPGVGAQGGSLKEVVKTFRDYSKTNFLVNISRGLLYIDKTEYFPDSVSKAILQMNNQVSSIVPL